MRTKDDEGRLLHGWEDLKHSCHRCGRFEDDRGLETVDIDGFTYFVHRDKEKCLNEGS